MVVVTGYVDAVGFLELGHLFVSFMSGDSTQFAVAGGQLDWARAGEAGAIIALFVGGVAIGRAIERLAGVWRRTVVLLVEAALLGAAAAIGPSLPAVVVLMVVAMGLQNSAIHRAGDTELSLTYVTGVLVNLGQRAVDALGAKDATARWAWAPYLLLWIALAGGSAAGAAAFGPWRLQALFIPAAVLALLAGVTAAVAAKGEDEPPAPA
ncbi:MAG: YoaK family protein [Caulobacteraceae bacterium]